MVEARDLGKARGNAILVSAADSDEHRPAMFSPLAYCFCSFPAALTWHVDVEDHHIRIENDHCPNHRASGMDRPHVMTFVFQEHRQGQRSVVVVVCDEDSQRAASRGGPAIIAAGWKCYGPNLAHNELFATLSPVYVAGGRRKRSRTGDRAGKCRTITTG